MFYFIKSYLATNWRISRGFCAHNIDWVSQVKLQRWRLHISTHGIKTVFHRILSTFSYFDYFLKPFGLLVFRGYICVSVDNLKIIVPTRLGCGLPFRG